MSIIYEKFDDEKQDITLLDSIDPDISKMLVEKYIETFIYERLIHDVGNRIEKKAENSATAAKIEKELKEYIETKVSTTLKDKPLSIINSETKNVHVLVEELYQQCYKYGGPIMKEIVCRIHNDDNFTKENFDFTVDLFSKVQYHYTFLGQKQKKALSVWTILKCRN
jgi:hypothetical protein